MCVRHVAQSYCTWAAGASWCAIECLPLQASLQGKDKAACGSSGTVPKSLQRFTLVVEGSVVLQPGDSAADTELHQDMFAFCPSADACRTQLRPDAAMLVFERMAPPQAQTPGAARAPEVQIGKVADVPTLETGVPAASNHCFWVAAYADWVRSGGSLLQDVVL